MPLKKAEQVASLLRLDPCDEMAPVATLQLLEPLFATIVFLSTGLFPAAVRRMPAPNDAVLLLIVTFVRVSVMPGELVAA
jgi:hypothetical protein